MKDKLLRAGKAHDEVVEAFVDIFGPVAENWFDMPKDVLTGEINNLNIVPKEEIDVEAEYKRMQAEAAAKLEEIAASRGLIKAEGTEAEGTEAEDTEAESNEAEGTEAEGTEAEGTEAEDTEAEDTEAEDTEAESNEAEGTEAEAENNVENVVEKPLDVDNSELAADAAANATAEVVEEKSKKK